MIDYEKLKTRRGLWKKTEQPGYVKPKCSVDRCQHDPVSIMGVPYEVTMEHGFKYKKCIKCGEFYR